MGYVVTVLETIVVSIFVSIMVVFLIDCRKHIMLVRNKMTPQHILLIIIEPRTLQIWNELKKVI